MVAALTAIAAHGEILTAEEIPSRAIQPLRFALKTDTSPDATLVGLQLDQPLRVTRRAALVAEIYGAKGDADMGVISAGLIARHVVSPGGAVAGVNVFYDALRDSDGFSYSRFGFGGDFNYGRLTLRANYYLPIGNFEERRVRTRERRSKSRDGDYVSEVDWTEQTTSRREGARGWEAEAEWALLKAPRFFDPRLAVGYYDFSGSDVSARESGVKVRGELRAGRHVIAEVEWRQDGNLTGQEWRAGIRVEFLLGSTLAPKPLTSPPANGKNVVPQPPVAENSDSPEYPRLYDPAKRLVWPEVLSGTDVKSSRKRTGRTTNNSATSASDPARAADADGCGCASGGQPLIYQ